MWICAIRCVPLAPLWHPARSGVLLGGLVFGAPKAKLVEHFHERIPQFGEGVFNLRRYLGIFRAHDEAIVLELLEVCRQRLVGDVAQIAETESFLKYWLKRTGWYSIRQ